MTALTMTAAARLAAKLLAHRQTSREEVGDLIRNVHGTLKRLIELPEPVAVAAPRETPAPSAAPARRRTRRPRAEATVAAPEEEAPAPPVQVQKLVRRADVTAPPPAVTMAPPTVHGMVRGVVRWFDPKSGKGALRLPGLGDVGFEGRLLADSGITRLFKGQEIEATLAEGGGSPMVQRLALPGAGTASSAGGGMVKGRHAKPVVVELKREALRRAAARAEAEHVLGSTRSR
jgi:cold shock CspA family protein